MLKRPLLSRVRPLNVFYRLDITTKHRDAVQNTRDFHDSNLESIGNLLAFFSEIIHADQALDPATGGQ